MTEESEEGSTDYIVISLTLEGAAQKFEGCKTIPADSIYPAIYRRVYGPASEQACKRWVNSNCS